MRVVPFKLGLRSTVSKIMDLQGEKEVVIVSVTGGSGSGKGYFIEQLKCFFPKKLSILHLDNYYRDTNGKVENVNHDHPSSLKLGLFQKQLAKLRQGLTVDVPNYKFKKHKAIGTRKLKGKHVIILDGLFSFYNKRLQKMADVKIFVYAPDLIRLNRRIKRDAVKRGQNSHQVKIKWKETVQPMYKKFVEPQRKFADLVIKNY
jgi:uridine kinase